MPAIIENEDVYTLTALVERWGEPTEKEVLAFVKGRTRGDLVAVGAEVSTTRIDTDAARLYGKLTAFLAEAGEEQLDHVPMLTEHLVQCGIWAAHQANLKYGQREAQKKSSGSAKDERIAAALTKIEEGKTRRETLWANLRALAGEDAALLRKTDMAYGTASDPKALAEALESLAQVGRAMLADKAPDMVARLKGSRIKKAWFDAADELASKVRVAGEAARATLAVTPVAQADVDYWDGIALALLSSVIGICEAGHGADPKIPRLVPISLRSWFSPRRSKKEKDEPQPPPPPPRDGGGPVGSSDTE